MKSEGLSIEELAKLLCRVMEQVTMRLDHYKEWRLSGGRLLLVGRNENVLDYMYLCDIEAVLREEMGRLK